MNKIFYTLFFLLSLSLFNNEAKAQTADVAACTKNASGAIVITSQISSTTDQTCDGEGATNVTLKVYSLGFCTSAPTVKFVAGGKAADERDSSSGSYSDGTSVFSSCTWTIKQSSTTNESLESVGDVEPLPSDEIPPPGTYTHAVLVISNEMTITGTATFSQTISGSTSGVDTPATGTKCWTNGSVIVDTGQEGLLIGSSISNASDNKTANVFGGGATCGSSPSPTANTIVSKYANFEPSSGTCSGGGCNTTRSEETTAFGNLTVLYTTANLASLATNSPAIQRSLIVTTAGTNGINTATNTLTAIFAYNNPMVVTDKTTGMEIFINFNNALAVDFEPSRRKNAANDLQDLHTNISTTNPPVIRSLQSGPFGIQFKAVEGGSTD
jgi:hypothetical protein